MNKLNRLLANESFRSVFEAMRAIESPALIARSPLFHEETAPFIRAFDKLTLRDVGVTVDAAQRCSINQCFELYADQNIQLAVFIIPKGLKVRLHDHPNMAVISKLLFGRMQVQSYTQRGNQGKFGIPVTKCVPEIKVEGESWCLTAVENNFHEFSAESTCVIIEALFPPYSEGERDCTYFLVSRGGDGLYLRAVPFPDDGPVSVALPELIDI
jgi:hypothetical protein